MLQMDDDDDDNDDDDDDDLIFFLASGLSARAPARPCACACACAAHAPTPVATPPSVRPCLVPLRPCPWARTCAPPPHPIPQLHVAEPSYALGVLTDVQRILVERDVDMSEEGAGRLKVEDDKCYVVIDSDSDDEYVPKKKKPKTREISSKGKSQKVSDTKKQLTQEAPIVITDDDDDDDDLEKPVVTESDSCDQKKIVKTEEEKDEFAVVQHKLSSAAGKQSLLKNLCQLPNDDPKAKPEILDRKLSTDEEPMPVVEQPRKRKNKTKNITVPPAVKERKKRKPSKKKPETPKSEKSKPGDSQCEIPGCFFHGLENVKQYSGRNYKRNKDELIQKIYTLLNRSVFDQKLPEKIDIGWNNKMLRTAGLCTTGKLRYPKRERYAKIQISLKVCDSADRLRDTLTHELCHAASWLLDGIRDSHGDMWRYYARKSNMVHPELPKVTRCHNYKINYKIHYECTQCKFRVGRYSRSLDTTRFICARCKGSLAMLPLTRKDGTPIKPHVRPFAKYVQENYREVKRETEGITHGDVMRKLSKDFFAKKQSQGI
ncbi:germ cell nuclear acidic protein [Capricornis sumatraensis]|uniref:germ cell nuclear acidic protein n=1 Tax=Capricornis sumatraensis TaxID=34865 RepID=UPI00360440A0